MRFLNYAISISLFFGFASPALATNDGVSRAIDFLKAACASGEKVEVKVDGDGGLNFLGRGAKGSLHFSKIEARGIAEGLSGEAQRANLAGVRDCMSPYITRVLDALLPAAQASEGQKPKK